MIEIDSQRKKVLKNLISSCLFALITLSVKAQDNSGCLTKRQLKKMQSSSLNDIQSFLKGEDWSLDRASKNKSFSYFNDLINYDVVSWRNSRNYYGVGLTLYNASGKPNIVVYQTNSDCFNKLMAAFKSTKSKTSVSEGLLLTTFVESGLTIEFREYSNDNYIYVYNSSALASELKNQQKEKEARLKIEREEEEARRKIDAEQEEARRKIEAEKQKRYDDAIAKGDALFLKREFEQAKFSYLSAKEIDNTSEVYSKIENCEKEMCNDLISKGDDFYDAKQYEKALGQFNKASSCTSSKSTLNEKIRLTKQKILENQILAIQSKAEAYFKENKLNLAIEQYQSVRLLDKYNRNAAKRIKEIEAIKQLLAERSTQVFSYKLTNENNYLQFKNNLLEDVRANINEKRNGYLSLDYLISFDTNGVNQSVINSISTSLNGYSNFLSKASQKGTLLPASKGGYFLAAKEKVSFDVKWKTSKMRFKSTSKGITALDYSKERQSVVHNFIKKQPFPYGNYKVEIKDKEFKGVVFSDIYMVKHRVVGPSSALYSMIFPGWGSIKVSYGKKGWGRLTNFILSTGLAIGSKLYSDAQYQNYLGATNQTDIDKYYKNANTSHKVYLVSGALSASIYLYDIIWAISQGSKNQKQSKPLRKQLSKGPISIQKQSITSNEK